MQRMTLTSLILAILLAMPAVGQLDRGTITGTVSDSTGARIPGATITVRNAATNASYKTESTAAGQYTVPNLPVGRYEAAVEVTGFKKFVSANLDLRATDVLRVDAIMQLGSMVETIEVTAEAGRIQTDSPQVGTSLTNKGVADLPLNINGSRSPEAFAYSLTPGVIGTSWIGHVNGSTTASKEVLLDGASVTTYRAGNFSESSVSMESVEEFRVQTSGMSAEFGRMQGGVFNFVMKSGGNQVHGSAYGALRNEALNANTFANNFRGDKRPQDRRQNGAVSFGGPVYIPKLYDGRDKTFFYTAYERYRERDFRYGTPNSTVPIPEFYEGDFSALLGSAISTKDALDRPVLKGAIYDPATFRQLPSGQWVGDAFPGNIIPKSRFSEVANRLNAIAQKYYTPTVRGADGKIPLQNNAYFPANTKPLFDQHQFSVKGDQIIDSTKKLTGSFAYVSRPRLQLGDLGMWDMSDPEGGPLSKARWQTVVSYLSRAAYDWTITPQLLANFNVSWNRMVNPNLTVHSGVNGAKELGIQNLSTTGYPTVSWGGGPYVTLDTPGATQENLSVYGGTGAMATFSLSKGRHFLKWGFDHRRNSFNVRGGKGGNFNFNARATAIPNTTFSGTQTGYAFASYLLGIVDSAGLSAPVGLGGRRHYWSSFFQDDFKVNSRLTLNLGVRWEYQPPYYEVADRLASWNPEKVDPETGYKGAYDFAGSCSICTGQRYFGEKHYRYFGPRIGLAWQPASNWTVRAAYGIFFEGDLFDGYSAAPGSSAFAWQGSYQLSADPVEPWRGIFNWDDGFPTDRYLAPTMDVSRANRGGSPSMIDPSYGKSPYTQQWNFNLQRRLTKTMMLDIGYVGNKSTGLRNEALARLNQLPVSVLTDFGSRLTNPVRNAAEAAANGVRYPYAGYSGTVAGVLREFPQLQGISTVSPYAAPLGFATYNSLQVTVDKQMGHGLSLYANYVWSKTLGNTESSFIGDNSGPLDYYNLTLEKTPASFDIPHMFKANAQWEIPVGKGRMFAPGSRIVDALIGGWAATGIVNYFSGAPMGFSGASSPMPNGWNGGQRPNIAAGDMRAAGYDAGAFNLANTSAPENTYLNKSLFSDPVPFTLGTAAPRYTTIRGFGTISEDMGLLKNFRVRERYRFQVRGEFLNVFNRHQLGGINTNIKNVLFGQVTSVSGNRSVQLIVRLDF
jgi:hypothetical protein